MGPPSYQPFRESVKNMKSMKREKVFIMVGFLLLGLTTELVVLNYYWATCTGAYRLLLIGLCFVVFVQLYCSHWFVTEDASWSIIKTSFFASIGLALVMTFNAAMILIARTEERKVEAARAAEARIEADKRAAEATVEANKFDQESRAKIAQIQAESDAIMATKDWRMAREARIERENRAKIEADEKRRKDLQAAAVAKPVVVAAAPAQAVAPNDFKDAIDFAKWYCQVLVLWVPLTAGIICIGSLGWVIMMSRKPGASQAAARSLSSSAPNPLPGPMPLPGPLSGRAPNGEPSLADRIRMRDGAGSKN